jgi:hypothetical protein
LREGRFLSKIEEVSIGDEGFPVHVARAENVLYLPDRGLQFVRDRFVPLETTPYPGSVAYVQKKSLTGVRIPIQPAEAAALRHIRTSRNGRKRSFPFLPELPAQHRDKPTPR